MISTWPLGSNPVLLRELRVALRNPRTFLLLGIYIAALGTIAVMQFPSGQAVAVGADSTDQGQRLFWSFGIAQAALVVLLFPALASGALSAERERHTLEPLLMTPLRPLQIVWGKAGGVLCLAMLLVLATLPLTSFCFLLGGVAPGELVAAYATLLGLSAFSIGWGLYCGAKYSDPLHALLACYIWLPVIVILVVVLSPFGSLSAGLYVLWLVFVASRRRWRAWGKGFGKAKRGGAWMLLFGVLWVVLFVTLLQLMALHTNLGDIVIGVVFVMSYLLIAMQMPLREAAHELTRLREPAAPLRQRLRDWQEQWRQAWAPTPVVYTPQATGRYTYTPQVQPKPRAPEAATYGTTPFLSDAFNPIYTREMRSGLGGKLDHMFRFLYLSTIASELLLLVWMAVDITESDASMQSVCSAAASVYLGLLMAAGAWFGSRTIALERERQTLEQLLTIPMPASRIIAGKTMAVLTYTFYVFVLGLPLACFLAMLKLISWGTALGWVSLEFACACLAATWGIFCSARCITARRALGQALGGVAALVAGGWLGTSLLSAAFVPAAGDASAPESTVALLRDLCPTWAMQCATSLSSNMGVSGQFYRHANTFAFDNASGVALCVIVYLLAAILFSRLAARDFSQYRRWI